MVDLDPVLQRTLRRWRAQLDAAEQAAVEGEALDRIRTSTLHVTVQSDLDDSALAAAGLRVTLRIGGLALGEVAMADAERLARLPGVFSLVPDPKVRTLLNHTVEQVHAKSVWNGTPGFRGSGVVIGIIDTGIDIFHGSFRKADPSKTRILRLWDQNAPVASPGMPFGAEHLPAAIEAALAADAAHPNSATFPHRDRPSLGAPTGGERGHGTHVAGIAAGDGSPDDRCADPFDYVGVAPDADLIVVALLGGKTIEAIEYIFRHAGSKAAVVNISLGWDSTEHDGTSLHDRLLHNLLHNSAGQPLPGRAIVAAVGNTGDRKRHARKSLSSGGTTSFAFEIVPTVDIPQDETSDRLYVWFDGGATLAVTLQGPPVMGTVSHTFPVTGGSATISGTPVDVDVSISPQNGKNYVVITLDGSPTNPVTPGEWRLRLTGAPGTNATVDIWIQQDDLNPVFLSDDFVREDTIGNPANSADVIAVGSYNPDRLLGFLGTNFDLSAFSGRGIPLARLPAGRRLRPDIVAPGEDIMAPNSGTTISGPPSSTCCEYLHVDMDGTSAAAPHVTGAVALMFQKNPTLTFVEVRNHLMATASRENIPSSEVPPVLTGATGAGTVGSLAIHQNHLWGAGRLDVRAAMASIPAGPAPPSPPAPPGGSGGGGSGGGSSRMSLEEPDASRRRWRPIDFPEIDRRPAFQLFAALVSTHVDEIRRLIDTNRRIAVVWRRGGGPLLVRHRLQQPPELSPLLPESVEGFSSVALLDRLMRVLTRFGSSALRADIERWRDFLLAIPGADIDVLGGRLEDLRR